jgi:hypothetical protein
MQVSLNQNTTYLCLVIFSNLPVRIGDEVCLETSTEPIRYEETIIIKVSNYLTKETPFSKVMAPKGVR